MDNLQDFQRIMDVADLEFGVLKPSLPIIAPSFKNLSTLKTLDLSRTNIQSLPPSISMLSLLQSLTLQECSMLTELPLEIGMLKNLVMFDLEGTEIMYLPEEMGKLENLQCLRVSFCAYADEYKDSNGIENIIPRNMISKFSKLGELSIYVNPDGKWWEVEVLEAVLKNLHFLPCLQTLKLYLPTAKELQYFIRLENRQVPIYSTLQDFSLQIGHSKQLTSYLKTKLLDGFEKLEKCLKYVNGEGSTDDIKELIRQAKALFIFRQWTIQKLSIFDISRLKYCLLAQCSEMHTIVDADEFYGDTHDNDGKYAFENLEYLAIHSMKKLQSIWKGPMATNSLSCLQVLALHTCRDLTTIFTEDMLAKLDSLTVVIVEDCPKVKSLVTRGSIDGNIGSFLPKLRKILLLDLPELVSLSSGVYIAPQLDTLLVFNCLKLDYLSHKELSRDVKEIKGETEWWEALKNKDEYSRAFVPLKRDGDLMNQLDEDTNSFKVFHKLQSRGSDDDNKISAMKAKVFRLFGGKPADLLLWKDKKLSGGILGGVTIIWFLFEVLEYHLLTLVCHSLILTLALLFLWSNASTFIKKSQPKIPEVSIPEKPVLEIVSALRIEINRGLAAIHDIASGKDLKKFLSVIAGLWFVSIISNCYNFLTLVYISIVLLFSVPVAYDKYEDKIDPLAEKAWIEIKKQYAVLDAKVLCKIPRSMKDLKEKKKV